MVSELTGLTCIFASEERRTNKRLIFDGIL
jgi:hypothetical protein